MGDGSVLGHWKMEMCTIMKCDPSNPSATCRQDQLFNYDFLSRSDSVFTDLKLSGTFVDGARVYPEVLFDDVRLIPELVDVSTDGVLSLFGRVYEDDPKKPDQYCPV